MKSKNFSYKTGNNIDLDLFIALYESSTLGERRPVGDRAKMAKMLAMANLVISAWDMQRLVGVARSLSDFAFCTYLSDLAVDHDYQRQGIGKELIKRTLSAGGSATLFLFAAPKAIDYYPHIGMTPGHGYFLSPA